MSMLFSRAMARSGMWLMSMPCLVTILLYLFESAVPRSEALAFGRSGFDVLNVWMILSWPFGALAVRYLHRARITVLEKTLLYPVNLTGIFLSICILLAALDVAGI